MVVLAVVLAAAYLVGVRRERQRGHDWPLSRTISALGSAAAVAAGGLVDEATFLGHMVGHLLLGMVAPFLLALGAPFTLLLRAGSAGATRIARKALHWRPLAILTHPVVSFTVFGASLMALYLTPLLELSQRNTAVHVLIHVHLVVVGSLFLWPLVGVDPTPRRVHHGGRLLSVLVAVPFHAFLGLALLAATDPVAPGAYGDVDDQHRAAALLWASGELLSLAVAAVVFRSWRAADEREAARLDRRLDGVPFVP